MQETWVQSLGKEDSLKKGMATHFSILGWRIPWTEEPRAAVHRVTKSQTWLSIPHSHAHEHTHTHTHTHTHISKYYPALVFQYSYSEFINLYMYLYTCSIQSAKTRPGADYGSDHELLIAKFWLKLKKVGKTTRPISHDLNQTPYDYTVEVMNKTKD